jgi:hypothetical protein
MWTPHSIGGRQNGPILLCIRRGGGRRRPAIQRLTANKIVLVGENL